MGFLSIPKPIFDAINTLAYLLLSLLICNNILISATGASKTWLARTLVVVFVNFMLMFALPAFGQNILWITGSANYMWLILLPLAMLLVLQKAYLAQKPVSRIWIAAACPLAFMAGWSSEGLSASLALTAAFLAFWSKRTGKGDFRLLAACAICIFIGMIVLWLAPGNFARTLAESGQRAARGVSGYFSPLAVAARLWHSAQYLVQPQVCLIPFLVVANAALSHGKTIVGRDRLFLSWTFLGTSMCASMSVAPVQLVYARMFIFSVVPAVIASGIVLNAICSQKLMARVLLCLVLGFSFRAFIHEAKGGLYEFERTRAQVLEVIEQQKALGNLDVVTMPDNTQNRFCAAYGLDDIEEDPLFWTNKSLAKYWGLNSIRAYKPSEAATDVNLVQSEKQHGALDSSEQKPEAR
ncbi:MAG: DUF6056 family protein [Aeromonadales bacterium]|nr:DUF6056 family protein [Aeromonadales bacterium]MDY2890940.1 DUF6056 family protein [Succinivibrio sp.]